MKAAVPLWALPPLRHLHLWMCFLVFLVLVASVPKHLGCNAAFQPPQYRKTNRLDRPTVLLLEDRLTALDNIRSSSSLAATPEDDPYSESFDNHHNHHQHHPRQELFGFRRWVARSWGRRTRQQQQRMSSTTMALVTESSSSSSSLDTIARSSPLWSDSREQGMIQTQQQIQQPPNQPQQQFNNNDSNNNNNIKPQETKKPKAAQYHIHTVSELDSYFADEARRFRNNKTGEIRYNDLLDALNVQGDTQCIGSPELPDYVHPVAQLMHQRKKHQQQQPQQPQPHQHHDENGKRKDGRRLAVAIEGGGMRGCVSAGMVCALDYLNFTDTIDVVYGSSAGTIVGAYLITGQVQWLGPEVYYDQLTTAGRAFIDTRRLMRAIGLGLLDPRLLKDVVMRPHDGKPVLNLPFLLKRTVQRTKPLNWTKFVQKQAVQPLKIIASGLKSERAVVLDMEHGHFETLEELTDCMHASCLLPGIAGPLMNLDTTAIAPNKQNVNDDDDDSHVGENSNDETKPKTKKLTLENNKKGNQYEPLADALVYEPLPYRSALAEGATDVLVIRSRPDGKDVTGKSSFVERLIFRRFFKRKNRLPHIYKYFRQQRHKYLYAQDILRLNEHAYYLPSSGTRRDDDETNTSQQQQPPKRPGPPHLMTIAVPPDSPEVTKLETGRQAIFEGFRRGFARAYDCLVEDPAERGRGAQVALEYFPDEILDYDPLLLAQEEALENATATTTSSVGDDPTATITSGPVALSTDAAIAATTPDNGSAFEVYMRKYSITPKAWKERRSTTLPSPSSSYYLAPSQQLQDENGNDSAVAQTQEAEEQEPREPMVTSL
ncbi:hypothetical protein ACA910_018749 [Epithemia clementina (nom. ined.)]